MDSQLINLRRQTILDRLRVGPASWKELLAALKNREQYTDDVLTCSKKTFERDKEAIARALNIEIEYDPRVNKYKRIDVADPTLIDKWLANCDLMNIINKGYAGKGYIFFEKRQNQGTGLIKTIADAIEQLKKLEFNYKNHYHQTFKAYKGNPLALKEALGRWYLIMQKENGDIRTFGLDRIDHLHIVNQHYTYPEGIDIEKMFADAIGILSPDYIAVERVLLRCTQPQGKYLETYPLHRSQRRIDNPNPNDDHCLIELHVKPTLDLEMELLAQGEKVEVLAPQGLRQTMAKRIEAMAKMYK